MAKKVTLNLSDEAHEAVARAAGGRTVGRFLRDTLESYARADATSEQGATLDERVERIVGEKLERAVARGLKDQTLVELETAERVAERAIKWAKIAGVFLAVPVAVFVALFSFLGVKTYFDLRDVASKIANAETTIKVANELSEQAQAASKDLIDRTNLLRPTVAEAEAIVERLRSVEEQIPALEERQRGLEEQLRTIEGRVTLGSAEADLEGPFRDYLRNLDDIGFPVVSTEIRVERSNAPRFEANTTFDGEKLTIGRKFWNSLSAALAEYTHVVLADLQERREEGGYTYRTLERALADYFPSSFLKDPRVGLGVDKSLTGGKEYLPTIENDLHFVDLSTEKRDFFVDAPIWGGLFWELRGVLGKKDSDKALFEVWRALPHGDTDEALNAAFSAQLLENAIKKAETEAMKEAVKRIWRRRGFPTKAP